jgi:hypothetical protein
MKKLMYLWVALLTLVFTVSCDKNDDTVMVDPTVELVDVSFDLNNYIPAAAKDLDTKADGDEDQKIPICSDLAASYVMADIDGTVYTLKLVTLNGGMETEVIKLLPDTYDLNEFVVYNDNGTPGDTSDDIPIYASPIMGSYYQALWSLEGVAKEFRVDAFTKSKVTIDVLCYKPFQYEAFGFAWFEYAKYQVKTVCFFGDICTKFFEEFHMNDNSPYYGQDFDGYDFPAIFNVVVKNGENIVNDLNVNSNAGWYGAGEPLCIEYPDLVGVDESYTFEISLAMPDGTYVSVYTGNFTDANWSGAEGDNNFGGADGVFDFVVGNCSYDGNNANMELPAWIPIPTGMINFTLSNPINGTGAGFFSNVVFNDLNQDLANTGATVGEWTEGLIYNSFCADPNVSINVGPYDGYAFSSLNVPGLPASYQGLPWGKLNWIANNMGSYSAADVQDAIWYTIGTNPGVGANNALAMAASSQGSFIPTVGDWAVVVLDAEVEGSDDLQLVIVRVDP